MPLIKQKVEKLVKVVDERNDLGIRDFYGININKEFMSTVAITDGLDESKYKIVKKNRFVYSGMQTGRDKCIRIGMYTGDQPVIVSPAYTTFEVFAKDVVIPEYFFMFFLSTEKDRLGWFYSDSSIRTNLDWDRFCDIDIELPPIEIQQKYVDIYKSMVENQKNYECGLEDLVLATEIILEKFKYNRKRVLLGDIVEEVDVRNKDNAIKSVHGVNKDKCFIPSVATGSDISNYKVVQQNQFACNLMHIGRDVAVPISLLQKNEPILVSPAYLVFTLKEKDILAEYLLLWMSRGETDRYAWFMSDTNVRSGMEKKRFYEIDVPLAEIEEQKSLVEIYKVLYLRKDINERLKAQIKDICPILIKGSLEEARK